MMNSNMTTIPFHHSMASNAIFLQHLAERQAENYSNVVKDATNTSPLMALIIGGGGGGGNNGQVNATTIYNGNTSGLGGGGMMQQIGSVPIYLASTNTAAGSVAPYFLLQGASDPFSSSAGAAASAASTNPYTLLAAAGLSSVPSSSSSLPLSSPLGLLAEGSSTKLPFPMINASNPSMFLQQQQQQQQLQQQQSSTTSSVVAAAYRNWLLERAAQDMSNVPSFASFTTSSTMNHPLLLGTSNSAIHLPSFERFKEDIRLLHSHYQQHDRDGGLLLPSSNDPRSTTSLLAAVSTKETVLNAQQQQQDQAEIFQRNASAQLLQDDLLKLQRLNPRHNDDGSASRDEKVQEPCQRQEQEQNPNKKPKPSNNALQRPQEPAQHDKKHEIIVTKKDKKNNDNSSSTSRDNNKDSTENANHRFQAYQSDMWHDRFNDLVAYKKQHGHCQVPLTYGPDPILARWVKRQRYQYKLMCDGRASTMTKERVKALEEIGFVWDSQGTAWWDRFDELVQFKREHQHCNVPSRYPTNPALAVWVKCQRRQYKLFNEGALSNITPQRIRDLESIGFQWLLRSYHRKSDKPRRKRRTSPPSATAAANSSRSSASSSGSVSSASTSSSR